MGQNRWKPAYTVQVSGLGVTAAAAEESAEQQEKSADNQDSSQADEGEAQLININTATAEELTTLPGIGETRAAAIIAYREEHGAFRMVEQLTDVSGIGEGILAQVIDQITVGNGEVSESGENTGS